MMDGVAVKIRQGEPDDVPWVIALSVRVQEALTSSGSKQVIGPLQVGMVESAISARCCYILSLESTSDRLGSVIIMPLPHDHLYHQQLGADTMKDFSKPHWVLQSLMLEPEWQGKRIGIRFLAGVAGLMGPELGTIFLDCWEGNTKLQSFYSRAGFKHLGTVPENDYYVAVFAKEMCRED
ncbi:acyl-CoA N-acyltransferase [Phialemonium atrogriseum]|uniref:Acyl-CoA N-acyltransferase n=1 Tax=Phialemonium atrogriseum TaxID=1093897 RepID=A0AAJ0BTH9_9PEZI|nr:acyl-CoA N-acyltransferase [Phialemonium atrogriseum]KAK1763727.1 acyl-CoA N-acyltransferase [Phialemonium atrogriseum]